MDLRGLGPNRTLVLVDGKRLGQGSPQTTIASPAPDIDQIPAFLVERVDVLTGGASSVYGADAVAGVVNFIMKKNFQGLQIDGQLGEDWHHNGLGVMDTYLREAGYTPLTGTTKDGRNRTFNLIGGTNFDDDKGNVTVYLSYLQQDPIAGAQSRYRPVPAHGTVRFRGKCGRKCVLRLEQLEPLHALERTQCSHPIRCIREQLCPVGHR